MLKMIQHTKSQGKCYLGFGKKSRLAVLVVLAFVSLNLGSAVAQDQSQPAAEDGFDYSSQTLRVGVWMVGKEEGDILQKGEKFTVGIQANQDAYAVVYHIGAEGAVSVLWPRSRFDDGFIFGGHEYLLPVSGDRRLVASAETGEGFVEAIVSSYPFDLRDLELDFHHEFTDNPWNFQVTGDPFLAMNEVNYVVTGLEDSGDYVITNHLSYYVHQAVDHPRFLCGQCHFEEDVAYDPYNDTCTLDITYDYGWSNSWYDNYGYYPVYSNPVYVYVDPWTYRPWVNFWYDPWYTCAPGWGWGWGWGYSCYSWGYSPYYGGGCYDYYGRGYNRYGPLDRSYASNGSRVKSQEYGRVSGLMDKNQPSQRDRNAMKTRTTLADNRGGTPTTSSRAGETRSGDSRFQSTERSSRTRPQIETGSQLRSNGGLRIKDTTQSRAGGDASRSAVRHTAGGGTSRAEMTPVRRANTGPTSNSSTLRANSPTGNSSRSNSPSVSSSRTDKPASTRVRSGSQSSGSRTIKPVEPRKKGTRVWNTRPESKSQSRSSRSPSVKSGSRTRQPSVSPGRSSSGRKSSPSRSSRGSTSVKSGGSSKSSGGSRGGSSGGSRSGGSSGGSRGGGSSGGSRGGSGGRR